MTILHEKIIHPHLLWQFFHPDIGYRLWFSCSATDYISYINIFCLFPSILYSLLWYVFLDSLYIHDTEYHLFFQFYLIPFLVSVHLYILLHTRPSSPSSILCAIVFYHQSAIFYWQYFLLFLYQ